MCQLRLKFCQQHESCNKHSGGSKPRRPQQELLIFTDHFSPKRRSIKMPQKSGLSMNASPLWDIFVTKDQGNSPKTKVHSEVTPAMYSVIFIRAKFEWLTTSSKKTHKPRFPQQKTQRKYIHYLYRGETIFRPPTS